MTLEQKKEAARKAYSEANKAWRQNIKNNEKWLALCEAKRNCMLLGVII